MSSHTFYKITPMTPQFGALIGGIQLSSPSLCPLPEALIHAIKEDVKKYRLLIFKEQGLITGQRQVDISSQLGEIESTFYKHPKSPHPDVFRVSNDSTQGCVNVGRTGWHLDGTFQSRPFKYQTMHFHSICEGGETWFVPLKEFYELQDKETQSRWDDLWFATRDMCHPMVYQHPVRKDTTMLFHCGRPFCDGWKSSSSNTLMRPDDIQDELTDKLNAVVDQIGVKMKWEVGDFAINDNVGNAHYAAPGTQNKAKDAGLRILHRTTIAGETIPTKASGEQSFRVRFS